MFSEKVIAALQSRPRDNPDTSSDPSDGRPSNNFNLEDRYMHLDVHKLPGVDPIDIQSKLSPNTEWFLHLNVTLHAVAGNNWNVGEGATKSKMAARWHYVYILKYIGMVAAIPPVLRKKTIRK